MNCNINKVLAEYRKPEVNIFEFDASIYGRMVKVTLQKRLRSEVKFNGLDALKAQLALDKLAAIKALINT